MYKVFDSDDGTSKIVAVSCYQQLRQYTDACLYLSPISYRALYGAEDKEKNLPDTVDDFYYFEV